MLKKFLFYSLFYSLSSLFFYSCNANPLETSVMGLSAASSMKNLDNDSFLNFKGMFTPNGEVEVENVVFSVDDDMNEKGAVTVYIVICYDKILLDSIKTDSASQFKNRIKTYKNDYPDKFVVLEWPIQAKKRVSKKINIAEHYEKDNMVPVGGYIFVTYSSPGEHRYKIPSSWKEIKICLKKKECELEQLDAEN